MLHSEKMRYYEIYVTQHHAYEAVASFGSKNAYEFVPQPIPSNKYVKEIRQIDKIKMKMKLIEKEVGEVETKGDFMEADVDLQVEKAHERLQALKRMKSEIEAYRDRLREDRAVLRLVQSTIDDDEGPSALGTMAGVIDAKKAPLFESVVRDSFKRNVVLRRTIATDTKNGYLAITHGTAVLAKLLKVFVSLGGRTVDLDAERYVNKSRAMLTIASLLARVDRMLDAVDRSTASAVSAWTRRLPQWAAALRRNAAVLRTLNGFTSAGSGLLGGVWVPWKRADDFLRLAGVLDAVLVDEAIAEDPPVLFEGNDVISPFQEMNDMFEVPAYGELNPACFHMVSFPFLFGCMFSDAFHGLILLLFSLFMFHANRKINCKKIQGGVKKQGCEKSGELENDRSTVENIYSSSEECSSGGENGIKIETQNNLKINGGLKTNDNFYDKKENFNRETVISIPPNLNDETNKEIEEIEENEEIEEKVAEDLKKLLKNETEVEISDTSVEKESRFAPFVKYRYLALFCGLCSIYFGVLFNDFGSKALPLFSSPVTAQDFYPFGIDHAWHAAANKDDFINNLKMKMCVIFGFFHMLVGHGVNIANCLISENYTKLVSDALPSLGIFLCFVGYLTFLIFYKWLTDTTNPLVDVLIGMFLRPGGPSVLYSWQREVELGIFAAMVFFFLSVFLSKGLLKSKKAKGEEESSWIESAVHVIEIGVGLISNTSSYLRLWAVSLTHGTLTAILHRFFIDVSFYAYPITVPIYSIFTILVLIVIEGLSTALHAVRLNWVEFNSKFLNGKGRLFVPLGFEKDCEE